MLKPRLLPPFNSKITVSLLVARGETFFGRERACVCFYDRDFGRISKISIDKYLAIFIIIIILIFLAFDHLANEIFLFRVEITFSHTRNEWKDARRKR